MRISKYVDVKGFQIIGTLMSVWATFILGTIIGYEFVLKMFDGAESMRIVAWITGVITGLILMNIVSAFLTWIHRLINGTPTNEVIKKVNGVITYEPIERD